VGKPYEFVRRLDGGGAGKATIFGGRERADAPWAVLANRVAAHLCTLTNYCGHYAYGGEPGTRKGALILPRRVLHYMSPPACTDLKVKARFNYEEESLTG